MPNKIEIYHSREIADAYLEEQRGYIYKRTGIMFYKFYSESEYMLFKEISAEIIPEPLDNFMNNLFNNSQEKSEFELTEQGNR